MSTCSRIILYTTSITAIPKVKADHDRIKRILDAKRVEYEEVSDPASYSVPLHCAALP